MSLQTYIDNKALFDHLGWPEWWESRDGFRKKLGWSPKEKRLCGILCNLAQTSIYIDEKLILSHLRDHCWKIIRDRYHTSLHVGQPESSIKFYLEVYSSADPPSLKEDIDILMDFEASDEDELLAACLQWILEQEKIK